MIPVRTVVGRMFRYSLLYRYQGMSTVIVKTEISNFYSFINPPKNVMLGPMLGQDPLEINSVEGCWLEAARFRVLDRSTDRYPLTKTSTASSLS